MIDPRFIVKLHGKEFILVAGLLDAGHKAGLAGIETEVIRELSNPEKQSWVVQATGTFAGETGPRVWSAYGDADPGNSQMRGAYLRHAETRAVARMLRFATNTGLTAAEELSGDEEGQPRPPATNVAPGAPAANGPSAMAAPRRPVLATHTPESEAARSGAGWEGPSTVCSYHGCARTLAHNTEIMSLQKYKRPLCLDHMKSLTAKQAA
jgi:hypothetical protein